MSKKVGIQLTNELEPALNVVKEGNVIVQGMVVGDTLYQNQYLILQAQKGEFKEHPTLGVGIADMASDDDVNAWKYAIRNELAKDGLKVEKLTFANGVMEIVANY